MELSLECQSRMPKPSFLGLISSFSLMPEMSFLSVSFGRSSFLLFWQRDNFVFVGKYLIYRKYHLFMYFGEISSFKKDHIFEKNKCHLCWWHKKDHILVWFFWKDNLFRTFGKKNVSLYRDGAQFLNVAAGVILCPTIVILTLTRM